MSILRSHSAHRLDAVVFDFDGTLADSLPLAYEFGRNQWGSRFSDEITLERLRTLHSRDLFGLLNVRWWQVPGLVRRYKQFFRDRRDAVALVHGIEALIRGLVAAGVPIAVVSTNSTDAIDAFLSKHGLREGVSTIVGGVRFGGKAGALKQLLASQQWSNSKTMYVGDEVRDFEACQRVPMPMIGVSWGWNSAGRLLSAGCQWVANDSRELLEKLLSWETPGRAKNS